MPYLVCLIVMAIPVMIVVEVFHLAPREIYGAITLLALFFYLRQKIAVMDEWEAYSPKPTKTTATKEVQVVEPVVIEPVKRALPVVQVNQWRSLYDPYTKQMLLTFHQIQISFTYDGSTLYDFQLNTPISYMVLEDVVINVNGIDLKMEIQQKKGRRSTRCMGLKTATAKKYLREVVWANKPIYIDGSEYAAIDLIALMDKAGQQLKERAALSLQGAVDKEIRARRHNNAL